MGFITSLFSGGLLGMVGNMFNAWQKNKELKIRNDHEARMVQVRTDAAVREADANLKIEEEITDREVETANAKGFYASVSKPEPKALDSKALDRMLTDKTLMGRLFRPVGYLLLVCFGVLDIIRGLTRPTITAGSLGFVAYFLVVAFRLFVSKGGLSVISAEDILKMLLIPIIELFLFVASMAASWYFADRQMAKDYRRRIAR